MTLQQKYDALQAQAIAESLKGECNPDTLTKLGQASVDLGTKAATPITEVTLYLLNNKVFLSYDEAQTYYWECQQDLSI